MIPLTLGNLALLSFYQLFVSLVARDLVKGRQQMIDTLVLFPLQVDLLSTELLKEFCGSFPETCLCLQAILCGNTTPILAASGRTLSKRPFVGRCLSAMQGTVARIFEICFQWSHFEDSLRVHTRLLAVLCL